MKMGRWCLVMVTLMAASPCMGQNDESDFVGFPCEMLGRLDYSTSKSHCCWSTGTEVYAPVVVKNSKKVFCMPIGSKNTCPESHPVTLICGDQISPISTVSNYDGSNFYFSAVTNCANGVEKNAGPFVRETAYDANCPGVSFSPTRSPTRRPSRSPTTSRPTRSPNASGGSLGSSPATTSSSSIWTKPGIWMGIISAVIFLSCICVPAVYRRIKFNSEMKKANNGQHPQQSYPASSGIAEFGKPSYVHRPEPSSFGANSSMYTTQGATHVQMPPPAMAQPVPEDANTESMYSSIYPNGYNGNSNNVQTAQAVVLDPSDTKLQMT